MRSVAGCRHASRGRTLPRSTPLTSGAACRLAVPCSPPSRWSLKPTETLTLASPSAWVPFSYKRDREQLCPQGHNPGPQSVSMPAEVAEDTPERAEGQGGVPAVCSASPAASALATGGPLSGQAPRPGSRRGSGTGGPGAVPLHHRRALGRLLAMEAGAAQGGCPQNRGQSLGALLLPPGWADRAPHLPWPGGGPGPGPSQADAPPDALMAVNLGVPRDG